VVRLGILPPEHMMIHIAIRLDAQNGYIFYF